MLQSTVSMLVNACDSLIVIDRLCLSADSKSHCRSNRIYLSASLCACSGTSLFYHATSRVLTSSLKCDMSCRVRKCDHLQPCCLPKLMHSPTSSPNLSCFNHCPSSSAPSLGTAVSSASADCHQLHLQQLQQLPCSPRQTLDQPLSPPLQRHPFPSATALDPIWDPGCLAEFQQGVSFCRGTPSSQGCCTPPSLP